ncbi:hypothetical protein TSAR_001320 [Trichomalopsis sarcophagae]|uniref:Uncharacterized protein n=1 Tax=Trichomalopsis sarcophagae TaxID=543379 RepID=A0A232EZ47_9HYME|nr:hypothetical protein TSAR_001320 [Trichomalopsis sarcophagae]
MSRRKKQRKTVLKGLKRRQWKEEMKKKGAKSHADEVIVGTNVELLQDGHNQEIRPIKIIHVHRAWIYSREIWPTIINYGSKLDVDEKEENDEEEFDFDLLESEKKFRLNREENIVLGAIDIQEKIANPNSSAKTKYPNVASNPFVVESWDKKRQVKRKRTAKVNISALEHVAKDIEDKEKAEANSINEPFASPTIERNAVIKQKPTNSRSRKPKENKRKTSEDIEDVMPAKNVRLMFAEHEQKEAENKIELFFNGSVKNPNYYWGWENCEIKIGHYLTKHTFIPFRDWLNRTVIDSFVAACVDEWADITYISHDDTLRICGDKYTDRIRNDMRICKTDQHLNNILFMPYKFMALWRLLIVDIEKKILTLLDPYDTEDDHKRTI